MNLPSYRHHTRLLLLVLCLASSGCYSITMQGEQAHYGFAWWAGPAVAATGLLMVPFGWFLGRRVWGRAYALMLAGPLIIFFVVPSMYSDSVVVDRDHFECRYGLWWSPSQFTVRYAELSEIHLLEQRDGIKRRRHEYLLCLYKTGRQEKISVGTLVRQAVGDILHRAEERGVTVANESRD